MNKSLTILAVAMGLVVQRANAQSVITEWNFDNLTAGATSFNPAPSAGSGSSSSLGMALFTGPDTSNIFNVAGTGSDNSGAGNNTWRLVGTNGWNSGAAIGAQGAQFNASTAGDTNIEVNFDIMITVQGETNLQVQYTTNGTTWLNGAISYTGAGASILTNSSDPNLVTGSYFHGAPNANDSWFNNITLNLSGIGAVNNDPNFGIRIVNAATGADDVNLKTNAAINNTSGNWRLDDVTIESLVAVPEPPSWALVMGIAALGVALAARRSPARA
jgi:hypothetical protein